MKRILNALTCTEARCSLVFLSDEQMREFNRTYRGIDRSTDVLSFSALEGEKIISDDIQGETSEYLGDILISAPMALSQATERGENLDEEIERLALHGLLHLLGYDHQTPADRRRMEAKARRVREAIRSDS